MEIWEWDIYGLMGGYLWLNGWVFMA